jgi:hypothetical protein
MSWREKAKEAVEKKDGGTAPTKPTKPHFVSSVSPDPSLSPQNETAAQADDALPDPKAEARRQRVLHLAWSNPDKKYAVHSDDDTTDPVMLAVAIRKDAHSVVTCEVAIPKANYDGFKVMELATTGKLELAVIDGGREAPGSESNPPESANSLAPEPEAA